MKKITSIEDVAAWQLCCGCGACAYIAPDQIEMIDTLEYGRRPRIKSGSTVLPPSQTMQVCPAMELTAPAQGKEHKTELANVWGPVLEIREGFAVDSDIRFQGSSGGAATALAWYAVEKLNMHGVLHIAPRPDIPYLNRTVFSKTRQDLLDGAGSRYAPASPCDGLKLIEDAPGPCVFIGKPCDVAAVRKAMVLRPELAKKIGLTIAFFCAGTPSTEGTLAMLRHMGVQDPTSVVSLRYRGCGWPGNAKAVFKKDEEIKTSELTYEQSWGDILQKYRQWRCYICPDHIGVFADITVADAWHRSQADYQPGQSVIIARTQCGREILQGAIQNNFIRAEIVGSEVLGGCRPGQELSLGNLWARLQMLRMMRIPTPRYRKLSSVKFWWQHLSLNEKVKSFLGTLSRIYKKQLNHPHSIKPYLPSVQNDPTVASGDRKPAGPS